MSEVKVSPFGDGGNLAIGHGALEHPEPAIRVDVSDSSRTQFFLGGLNAPGYFLRGLDMVDLDVNNPDPDPDA